MKYLKENQILDMKYRFLNQMDHLQCVESWPECSQLVLRLFKYTQPFTVPLPVIISFITITKGIVDTKNTLINQRSYNLEEEYRKSNG